jgi:glycosyltransferase involved in cell wall biosynthesis
MIRFLKDAYEVSAMAQDVNRADVVNFYPLHQQPGGSIGRVKKALWLKSRQFDRYIWTPSLIELARQLEQKQFDLIIAHDLSLLPFAFRIRQSAKIFFDAREYYPSEYEDQFLWRFLFKDLNKYLCRRYMTKCDQVVTVSRGIADEYQRAYGISAEVVLSLPVHHDVEPAPTREDQVRIIHHGAIAPSRRIEKMIQLMDHVDARFTLDLMLVSSNSDTYYQFLQQEASRRSNVRIIPPVRHTEIIPFTSSYDIGLFYLEPANFSLNRTIPNKLFEFIQARLAVAVTPTEMRTIIEQYECGVVSPEFDIRAMASTLNALTAEQIANYKHKSHLAAQQLNASATYRQVHQLIGRLLEPS